MRENGSCTSGFFFVIGVNLKNFHLDSRSISCYNNTVINNTVIDNGAMYERRTWIWQ